MPTPGHADALAIVQRLQKAGFTAFWVGGCVRDLLLHREPQDYDIATDARPEEIEGLFARTIAIGRKFGVITVLRRGRQYQVATFRAEADYRDGRRPEKVTFANARADASRRDFTVNGLFYDPLTRRSHDWVGGRRDLRGHVIRTIGKPAARFAEDHLRLLRAIRFAGQLNFTIHPGTWKALRAGAPSLAAISAERVRDELLKLLAPPHAARGLKLLSDSGLMAIVLPELTATINCEQSPPFHPEGSVFNHICLMLEQLPAEASVALVWSVLLHDVAKPRTASRDESSGQIHFYGHETVGAEMAADILSRLRFPKKLTAEIVTAVRYHMQFKDVPHMRKATLRRLLLRETFPLELALHRLDCLGSSGKLEIYEFLVAQSAALALQPDVRPPLINGHDLIALGLAPGKSLGVVLAEIRELQLADVLTSRRAALAHVRKNFAPRTATNPPTKVSAGRPRA